MPRRPFSSSERAVVAAWLAVCALVFAIMSFGDDDPPAVLIGLAGLVMVSVGLFIALNATGVADQLARRRFGLGSFWFKQSSASWRLFGGFVAFIGIFWALALRAA